MLEADVRVRPHGKRTYRVVLPADLVRDSKFPFGINERLRARVERNRLIIERASAPAPEVEHGG